MSDDALREFKAQLNRIERCLTGDPEMGQRGLVARVDNHGDRIKTLERWRFYYGAVAGGALGVIVLIYKLVTDWWPRR